MAKSYQYQARDRTGQVMSGTMTAENKADVAAFIRSKGYFITRITESGGPFAVPDLTNLFGTVEIKDLSVMCRQFSTMVDAGLSMIVCLNVLIDQTGNPKLKRALQDVYQKVQEGEMLSHALQRHPQVFPTIMVSMVEAGEVGGVMDDVLHRLAVHFEKQHKMNQKVRSAIAYPVVVIGIAVLSVSFIFVFVLPTFTKMFVDLKMQLPLPTRVLIGISEILRQYGIWLFGVLCATLFGLREASRRNHQVRLILDSVLLQVPVFGLLWRKVAIARFSRTLSTLLRGGVPILSAIDAVKKITDNMIMIRALDTVQQNIRQGAGMTAPLAASRMFTPMVVQMIAIGEETGELDKMLEKVADFYENDVDDMVGRLSSILEPLLIGGLGIVIGMTILGIMMPMFDIITQAPR